MFANHDHPIQRGRVFALIHSYLPNLSPAETRIAEYILRNPERCLNLGIVEMAKECSVSPAMVTRFTTKIGFTGFAAMKATLRVDILSSDGRFFEDIEIGDSANAIMEKVLDLAILGLQDTAATLDTSELVRAAKAILNARPLFFAPAGVSSTGVIMLYRQKLINLGILAVPPPDHSVASTYVSMVKPGDVVFGISHSGASDVAIDFLEQCQKQGATTICLTNYSNAPITRVSDIHLITAASRASPIFGEAITVRISQIAVLDALYATMAMMRYQQESELAGNHLGGER
jgi:RpiR family carbohydrate utilization transcriptional regulator